MAKKYEVRINYIENGEQGEGKFWWLTEEDIFSYQNETKYGLNPKHWSTTCFETIPCRILPELTGKKEWKLGTHRSNDKYAVFAYFTSNDNDTVIVELQDENGCCGWDEPLPEGPSLTVFGNGKEVPCNTAEDAAYTVASMIFSNCGPNRRMNLPAKRW